MCSKWSVKQTNQQRCGLLCIPVFTKLIQDWFASTFPLNPLTSIRIEQNSAGGLFDVYYNVILTSGSTTYIVRFFALYIPLITNDLFQHLYTMVNIREDLAKLQEENSKRQLEDKPIPYQSVPQPFSLKPPTFINEVIMMLYTEYDEETIGITSENAKQLFFARNIHMLKYPTL